MRKPIALVACCLLLLCGCRAQPLSVAAGEPVAAGSDIPARTPVESSEPQFATPAATDPLAIIDTSAGVMYAVLYPRLAPLAVRNFVTQAQLGYYNGTAFHRVVPGFAVQGGDPAGTGESLESIWSHPYQTENSGKLHHYAGALCTAVKTGTRHENGSQFYVVTSPQGNLDDAALQKLGEAGMRDVVVDAYRQAGGAPWLDFAGDTVFGQLYAGLDVADRIGAVPVDEEGRPTQPVTVNTVTITTVGEGNVPGLVLPEPPPAEEPPPEEPASVPPEEAAAPPPEGEAPPAEAPPAEAPPAEAPPPAA